MVEVARGRRDGPVTELLGDDPDIDSLGPQLGRVCVPEAVGVDPPQDPGRPPEPGQQPAAVRIGETVCGRRYEDRRSGTHSQSITRLKPRL